VRAATPKVIRWRGQHASRQGAVTALERSGDTSAVVRGDEARQVLIQCPCGCGLIITANLDERVGPAWRWYRNVAGNTLYPSVWLETGCKSHFVIWADRIWLWEDGTDAFGESSEDGVESQILASLPSETWVAVLELAERVRTTPWDALSACRRLKHSGEVEERSRSGDAAFRRLR